MDEPIELFCGSLCRIAIICAWGGVAGVGECTCVCAGPCLRDAANREQMHHVSERGGEKTAPGEKGDGRRTVKSGQGSGKAGAKEQGGDRK